jgi:UPF0755 protein
MLDDLDLSFDEDYDRGRHRHRRAASRDRKGSGRGRKPKRRGRSFLALFLTLAILGTLGFGAWYGFGKVQGFFSAPDYNSGGTGEVTVEVKKNETLTEIGQTLYTKGVVKSAKAFVNAANADSRSVNLQPGFYKLRLKMRAKDALATMLDGTARMVNSVTLPEGLSYKQTFDALSKATNIPVAEFEAAAKDPVALGVPQPWFARDDKKPVTPGIEGFLFPARYDFNPGVTATDILKAIVAKFTAIATKLDFPNRVRNERHISPYEALIAASIAQAEAQKPDDMAKVTRVLYNRAYGGKFPCSCLQLDSTVNYWLRVQGKETKDSKNLTYSELHDPNDPYNTHDKPGLPIGPIGNPGESALTAAMTPADGPWVYFLTVDKAGTMQVATTNAEFQHWVQIAKQNGVL